MDFSYSQILTEAVIVTDNETRSSLFMRLCDVDDGISVVCLVSPL